MSEEYETGNADIEYCRQCKWHEKPHCPMHGKDVSDVMYCGSWEEIPGSFQGVSSFILQDYAK